MARGFLGERRVAYSRIAGLRSWARVGLSVRTHSGVSQLPTIDGRRTIPAAEYAEPRTGRASHRQSPAPVHTEIEIPNGHCITSSAR